MKAKVKRQKAKVKRQKAKVKSSEAITNFLLLP